METPNRRELFAHLLAVPLISQVTPSSLISEPTVHAERITVANRGDKLHCSFCNKAQEDLRKLIEGPAKVYICDECVEVCNDIIADDNRFGGSTRPDPPPPAKDAAPSLFTVNRIDWFFGRHSVAEHVQLALQVKGVDGLIIARVTDRTVFDRPDNVYTHALNWQTPFHVEATATRGGRDGLIKHLEIHRAWAETTT